MQRAVLIAFLLICVGAGAGEAPTVTPPTEKIRGVLEKTVKPGACAQITDALSEIYYVVKSDEAEKAIEKYVGKNEKVEISGTVEYDLPNGSHISQSSTLYYVGGKDYQFEGKLTFLSTNFKVRLGTTGFRVEP